MDKDSQDGCYGTKCRDCEYVNAVSGSEEQLECSRLCTLALNKLIQEGE